MAETKSFKVGSDVFDIPTNEVQSFLKETPDAVEVESFIVGKDTFDIPIKDVQSFKTEMPNAQPLKKKEQTAATTTPSESGSQSGAPLMSDLTKQFRSFGKQEKKPSETSGQRKTPKVKIKETVETQVEPQEQGSAPTMNQLTEIARQTGTKQLTQEQKDLATGVAINLPEAPLMSDITQITRGATGGARKPQYTIDGIGVRPEDLTKKLHDAEFINKLQNNEVNLQYPQDDEAMKYLIDRQTASGGRVGDVWESFKAGLSDFGAGVIGVESFVNNAARMIPGLENTPKSIREMQSEVYADLLKKSAQDEREKIRVYEDGIVNDIKQGNIGNVVGQTFNMLAESAPYVLSGVATGGAGIVPTMAIMGTTAASTEFAGSDDLNLTNREKVSRALLYGGAEAAFSSLPTIGIFNKNFSFAKGILKGTARKAFEEGGEQVGKEVTKELAENMTKASLKDIGIDLTKEVGGEMATTLTQMATDDILGVQDYNYEDYQKQLLETAALSLTGFVPMTTPSAIKVVKQMVDSSIRKDKGVSIKTAIADAVNKGTIDFADAQNISETIKTRIDAVNNLPENLSADNDIVDNAARSIELEQKLKESNDVSRPFLEAELNEVKKGVPIPLPNKYVNSAGKNTSELNDGQSYTLQNGEVAKWDATKEEFAKQPKPEKEKNNIDSFVSRMKSGEKFTEAEDLRFYENNKAEIEAKLEEVAPKETNQAGSIVEGEVKPIRQLGTGANVYFETEKHRVNDNLKNGKVLLNIGSKESETPMANIEFDSAIEAVNVAKELNRIYPKGVPDAVLIDKVVENIKAEQSLKATPQAGSVVEGDVESKKADIENKYNEIIEKEGLNILAPITVDEGGLSSQEIQEVRKKQAEQLERDKRLAELKQQKQKELDALNKKEIGSVVEGEVGIETLNPTGSIFVDYSAEQRDKMPLGKNITTYDKTAGLSPDKKITVYRGVPKDINEIQSGDFVTTNKQLAQDYAGDGKVISKEVRADEILDDKTEPLGEEYILREQPLKETPKAGSGVGGDVELQKGEKKIYHHTQSDLSNIDSRPEGTWFTTNEYSPMGARARGKNIISKIINVDKLKLATDKEYFPLLKLSEKERAEKLIEQGFDGVKRKVDSDTHYLIFDLNKLQSLKETPKAGSGVGGEVEEKVSGLQHTKSQLEEIAKEEGIDNAIASFKKDLSVKENRLAELTKYEKGKLPSQKTKTKEIQSLEKRIEEVRKDVENLEKIKVEQSLKETPQAETESVELAPQEIDFTEDVINQQNEETDALLGGLAEQNRKSGRFTKDGIEYVRNEKQDGAKGNDGEVRFTNDVSVPFSYKIIEAETLEPSHKNGIRNPKHFIPEAQPKSRTDESSIQAEESFANNPRFDELGENTNAYSGAPIVNERGEVIQGNNRSAGLKKGYERGNQQYKNDLTENAEKFGLTKEQVKGMKNPVLVREVKASDSGAIELGNYDVKDLETGGKRRIDPIAVTRRMPFNVKGKIAELLFKGDDTTLNKSIRDNFVKLYDLLSPYLNQAQKNTIQKDGQITEAGAKDLESVVQQFMFDNADVALPEIFENLSHTQKEGLRKALPYIFSTDMAKSILPDLQNAIIALAHFEKSGVADIKSWETQMDMFENATPNEIYTPLELKIAEILNNSKNQKEIKDAFQKYADKVIDKKGDMFTEPTIGMSKKDAIEETFKIPYNERATERKSVASDTKAEKAQKETAGVEASPKPPTGESKTESERAETKEQQPDKETGQGEVEKGIQSALDKLAEVKRKREEFNKQLKNLKSVTDPFKETEERAKMDRELFDAYLDVAKEYIKQGVKTIEDFAAKLGEDVNDIMKGAWETASKPIKKTLLTKRVYEGGFREETKAAIEKIGLTREVRKQEDVYKEAKKIVDNIGYKNAYEAILSKDVDGDLKTAFYGAAMEQISKIRNGLKNTDIDELNELMNYEVLLTNEMSNSLTKAGQESAMANYIYDKLGLDFNYTADKKKAEWEQEFDAPIPEEIYERFKEYETALKELEQNIKDLEKKAYKSDGERAFEAIKDAVKKKPTQKEKIEAKKSKAKKEIGDALNDIADILGVKLMAVGEKKPELTKAFIKLGKGLIKAGEANVADVIEKVKQKVKEKFGNKLNFDDYEQDLRNAFDKDMPKSEMKNGKLKIPKSVIREYVESGVKDIDELTKILHEQIKKDMPDITEREVRDAITDYGKTISNPDEIAKQINKMKQIGRIISALEDIENKKRPLKSGLQRDRLDAEQRAWKKRLDDALAELPIDDEVLEQQLRTKTDAAKQRLQNKIADLQYEIDKGEKAKREGKPVMEDDDIRRLKEELENVKKQHNEKFSSENEAEKELKRLNAAKKATQRRIEEMQRQIKDGDFAKKERKPVKEDEELAKARAEKLKIQDKFDEEKEKYRLEQRSKLKKILDRTLDPIWDISRNIAATLDMSPVMVQGKFLLTHPEKAARSFTKGINALFSEEKMQNQIDAIRGSEKYRIIKESKLGITEPNGKMNAREEVIKSNLINFVWTSFGNYAMRIAKVDPNSEQGVNYMKKWENANPSKAFERFSSGYLNAARLEMFDAGITMLQAQGKSFEDNKESYKNLADMVNTFTGRASLGSSEQLSSNLAKVFFSPRNWASQIKTSAPVLFTRQMYKWRDKDTPYKPSAAQKLAMIEYARYMGAATTITALAGIMLNSDDDEETGVETDPRSSDFMKIKFGDTRFDAFGGQNQYHIMASRQLLDFAHDINPELSEGGYKKRGQIMPLGDKRFYTPSKFDLFTSSAINKLSPSASMLQEYLSAGYNRRGERVTEYGKPYEFSESVKENLVPMYFGTFEDILKADETQLDGILAFLAYLGGSVSVYGKKTEERKKQEKEKKE